MNLFGWLGLIAQAIILGARAVGVTHETVALTIAKTILHLLNAVAAPSARAATPQDEQVVNPPT